MPGGSMNMKPDNAAFARRIHDVMVDQKHLPESVCLPGLNACWRPIEMSVKAAFDDIAILLGEALGTFDHYNDLTNDQWGAVQQLNMAKALLTAVHETLHTMAFIEQDH
jgi:hypothetical protein